MSGLQLGLLAIGVLVVAGVAIFNRIQERKAQRRTDAALGSPHPYALTADEVASAPRPDAALAPVARGAAAKPAQGREAALDPRLDYLVELEAAQPVLVSTVLEHWTAIAHRYAGRGASNAAETMVAGSPCSPTPVLPASCAPACSWCRALA